MGASISTLVGWTVVIGCIYVVVFGIPGSKKARDAVKGASQRQQRLEDKQNTQTRKEPKDKAKRQRGEAYSKDADEASKASQLKARTTKPSAPSQPVNDSSEDDVDNREFARQLASVKQGTNLNAPKKSDEKRHKSVKQSRAQVIDEKPSDAKVSAPSSTAGVDADDDESSTPSPEIKATDISGVSDMLEPKASGPSVLRLTDTDKVKPKKEKKAKVPEKVETKKQRQNRQKAEAAKALREETEKQRKVDMEAQRRQARIAEGRPAKDGSAFMAAAQNQPSAWNATTNGSSSSNATNGGFLPVQPLDTFDTSSYTDVSVPKDTTTASTSAKSTPAKSNPADSWIATLPSEEEQIQMLRDEEAWNTVPAKKLNKKKNREAVVIAESPVDSDPATVVPTASKPRAASSSNGSGAGAPAPAPVKSTKPAFSQKSSFAALSTNDDEDETEENEWEV